MRVPSALLLVLCCLVSVQARTTSHSSAYLSMEKKSDAMSAFADHPRAGGLSTVMTDAEMNAWFSEGGVRWPQGVSDVHIENQPAVVTGTATVDFDEVTAGRYSGNPLMMIFSGVHDVRVVAQATASNGRGSVRVESVSLDGVNVPRPALQFFIDRFIKPRYPEAGLNSTFEMPNRIDMAIVGDRQITFLQK